MLLRRLALALPLLLGALPARAGEMEIVPVLVALGREEKSAVVTIRNRSSAPARYQISLYAWDQKADGQMVLGPTEDVVAFPRVLALGPNEAKILRVGTTAKPDVTERAYRIFVEEMPPPPRPDEPSRVQVLSRVGIPVFVAPASVVVEKSVLWALKAEGAKVSFTLRNAGNVHLRPRAARLVFLDLAGNPIGEKALDTWYVLARGDRDYAAQVPPERCAEVRKVVAEVTLAKEVLRDSVDAPRGACAP